MGSLASPQVDSTTSSPSSSPVQGERSERIGSEACPVRPLRRAEPSTAPSTTRDSHLPAWLLRPPRGSLLHLHDCLLADLSGGDDAFLALQRCPRPNGRDSPAVPVFFLHLFSDIVECLLITGVLCLKWVTVAPSSQHRHYPGPIGPHRAEEGGSELDSRLHCVQFFTVK